MTNNQSAAPAEGYSAGASEHEDKAPAGPLARQIGFIHVPKTAGTSVARGLYTALQPRLPVAGFDRSMFGGFDDFQSVSEETRRYVYLRTDELPPDADLIAGHFSLTTIRDRYPASAILIILREPLSRVLSHWTFWRSEAELAQPGWGTWNKYLEASHHSFADFLSDPRVACQTDNVALRLLLWPHPLIPNDNFILNDHDQTLVEEAQARLATLSHVNAIENPQLANDLAVWLDRPFNLIHLKETQSVTARYSSRLADELTLATQDLWHARSRLDLALWLAVCESIMPSADLTALTETVRARSLERYAQLLR